MNTKLKIIYQFKVLKHLEAKNYRPSLSPVEIEEMELAIKMNVRSYEFAVWLQSYRDLTRQTEGTQ